mmetsp:Transcript_1116/g.3441  ORF Transcript_1116/g.3441 Transcript_1116/m.3441 type:complete len:208 (-) Transcript_1116:119-742(-)
MDAPRPRAAGCQGPGRWRVDWQAPAGWEDSGHGVRSRHGGKLPRCRLPEGARPRRGSRRRGAQRRPGGRPRHRSVERGVHRGKGRRVRPRAQWVLRLCHVPGHRARLPVSGQDSGFAPALAQAWRNPPGEGHQVDRLLPGGPEEDRHPRDALRVLRVVLPQLCPVRAWGYGAGHRRVQPPGRCADVPRRRLRGLCPARLQGPGQSLL